MGQLCLDATLLQLAQGIFTVFPAEGFTPPGNSLLQEDGHGETDGQGDLPEIPGEDSREAAGRLCGGFGHSCLPLPAEAEPQPGRGELDSQPFPSDELCPGSAGPPSQEPLYLLYQG